MITVFDPRDYLVAGHENDNAVTASTAFNPASVDKASVMTVQVYGGDARWRADGSAPTSSNGTKLVEGKKLTIYTNEDIGNFQIIAVSGIVEVDTVSYRGYTT